MFLNFGICVCITQQNIILLLKLYTIGTIVNIYWVAGIVLGALLVLLS